MDNPGEAAGQFLDQNYTCAQSVFKAVQQGALGWEKLDASLFAGFGGGFARTGRVCGAVVSATAILSHSLMRECDPFDRSRLNGVLQGLYKEVEERFGALECRAITGINFLDSEASKRYSAEAHHQKCRPMVCFVAKRVMEIMLGDVG